MKRESRDLKREKQASKKGRQPTNGGNQLRLKVMGPESADLSRDSAFIFTFDPAYGAKKSSDPGLHSEFVILTVG